jgi:hypothetical protein
MNQHIARITQILKVLTEESPASKNPIGFRLTPLLLEMDWTVKHISHLLEKEDQNKEDLKQYLSILYRDDEAADPLIRSWVRAARWMDSPQLQEIVRRRQLYQSLREELTSMVPDVQSIFGKYETRYIIPPLFRGKERNDA